MENGQQSGTCGDYHLRYGFDSESNGCVGYYYAGCPHPHNNFISYEDCQAICTPEYGEKLFSLIYNTYAIIHMKHFFIIRT